MARSRLLVLALATIVLATVMFFMVYVFGLGGLGVQKWNWSAASPESQGMISAELEATGPI